MIIEVAAFFIKLIYKNIYSAGQESGVGQEGSGGNSVGFDP